jgi:hypothetical protein
MLDARIKVTHQEHRMPRAFSPKAKALTPGFVKIVGHVERVHLQNRLLGELKGDVAKIWCCSQRRTGEH